MEEGQSRTKNLSTSVEWCIQVPEGGREGGGREGEGEGEREVCVLVCLLIRLWEFVFSS